LKNFYSLPWLEHKEIYPNEAPTKRQETGPKRGSLKPAKELKNPLKGVNEKKWNREGDPKKK